MSLTRTEVINQFNPSIAPANIAFLRDDAAGLGLGSFLLDLLRPSFITRSGLASSATQVEPEAGRIFAVLNAAGSAQLTIIRAGSPGATEVRVVYDADGIATLTFNAAVTGYQVDKIRVPTAFADKMAEAGV